MNEHEAKSYIISGKNRKAIVKSLLDSPGMAIEIAKKTNLRSQHINRTCQDLLKAQIIKDLTPKHKRNKVYALTKIGKEVTETLKKKDIL